MQRPQWLKEERESFWRRHYELAATAEDACEELIGQQLQAWLRELERTDGPPAKEQH